MGQNQNENIDFSFQYIDRHTQRTLQHLNQPGQKFFSNQK